MNDFLDIPKDLTKLPLSALVNLSNQLKSKRLQIEVQLGENRKFDPDGRMWTKEEFYDWRQSAKFALLQTRKDQEKVNTEIRTRNSTASADATRLGKDMFVQLLTREDLKNHDALVDLWYACHDAADALLDEVY